MDLFPWNFAGKIDKNPEAAYRGNELVSWLESSALNIASLSGDL